MEKIQFYTIAETEKILRLSRATILRWLSAGEIPSSRIGKRILIPGVFFEQLANMAMEGHKKPEVE